MLWEMELRILGPLELLVDERLATPRPQKVRALLAVLAVHPNVVVASEVLVDALWGGQPPPTARTVLQGHVSSLRKLLGAERIETRPPGYLLRLEPGELDAERFESLVAEAGRTEEAVDRLGRLSQALALWRGDALADFRYDEFAQAEITRLDDRRLVALEERFEAELALGRHAAVLSKLERLVAEHPLRERLRGQLMVGLYRAGRQSDALHVFQEGRRVLAQEVGIDPGPALQALERQILVQDPVLDLPEPSVAAPRQERKRITVLVIEFSCPRPTDPEELEALFGPALERAEATLRGFGATVQSLFANALIGIFGAPRAYEDDSERAVRAGAALVDTIGEDGRLAVRVGIERGDALVTIQGGRVEVTGEVVATASRLQATAAANEVALGEALKRRRATSEGREVPFVGRRHELGLLGHTHGRVVGERAAHLVTIAGEPGSGKTRLAREFAAFLERTESHTWLAGRCLPYGDGVTFWALGEIVKAAAGILESDDPETSAHKVAATLSTVLPRRDDRVWVEATLAPLVGLAGSRSTTREETFPAWRRFLEALAEGQPLVLLIEDLHWADPALLEFVDDLLARAVDVPLLVLCTTRLELLDTHPDWGSGKRNSTTITLPPLSTEETRELARAILGGQEPSDVVVARAGGNPLFVQELTRVEVRDVDSLPESMHAVIAARLDTLPPAVKQTAMDAAVIGEVFWPGAVASIAGIEEHEVRARLQQLVAGEVVRRAWTSSVQGQDEHSFLHVVVRDVAYEQIPKARRAQKHATAGAWIEQLAGERVLDHAELIAHHYVAALDYTRDVDAQLSAKARHFLVLAGDRAMQLDIAAAERFYGRALELVSADDPQRAHVLVRLAEAAQLAGELRDAEERFAEAIQELEAHGEELTAAKAMTSLALVAWRLGDTSRQRTLLDRAISLLESHPPGPELARAWGLKARTLVTSGRVADGLPWVDRTIEAAERAGTFDLRVRMLQFRGMARSELGDPGGLEELREGVRLGRELGLSYETAVGYSNLGELVGREEGPAEGLLILREAIDFAEQRGQGYVSVWSKAARTRLLFVSGAWDEALREVDDVLRLAQGVTYISLEPLAAQAEILVYRGAVAEAAAVMEDLLPLARRIGDLQALAPAITAGALVESARGKLSGAIELVKEIDEATRDNAVWRSRIAAECIRVCLAASDLSLAESLLAPSDTRGKDRRNRVLSARAALAEAKGELERAAALYAEVADLWSRYGHPLEHGHALLGEGRCVAGLRRDREAVLRFEEARAIFEGLGARPLVAEVDDQLAYA
jgi:DNA-binding SARP family transcriptional activator/tetratricopeptide (TPR) repeat protein